MSQLGDHYNKLIVINDKKYCNESSFINDGPIKKLKELGAIVIYANINNGALLSEREILERLNEISNKSKSIRLKSINRNSNINVNSFIFELLELLELYQPIEKETLIKIYKKIKNFQSFDFVKNDGTNYSKNKQVSYSMIIEFMKNIDFISENDENKLIINRNIDVSKLMFNYSEKAKNKLRSEILLERIKSGETPWLIH